MTRNDEGYNVCKDPCMSNHKPWVVLVATTLIASWLYIGKKYTPEISWTLIIFVFGSGVTTFMCWYTFACMRLACMCASEEPIHQQDDVIV